MINSKDPEPDPKLEQDPNSEFMDPSVSRRPINYGSTGSGSGSTTLEEIEGNAVQWSKTTFAHRYLFFDVVRQEGKM